MGKYIIETGDDDKIVLLTEKGLEYIGGIVSPELAQFGIRSAKEYEGPEEGECDNCSALRGEYHRGYTEAMDSLKKTVGKVWKAATRIACLEEYGGLPYGITREIFGTIKIDEVFKNTDPFDAVRLLEEFDKKQALSLGDEAELLPGHEKAVYICERPDGAGQFLLVKDGSMTVEEHTTGFIKTGSRYMGLQYIFDSLRDQNDKCEEADTV